MSGRGRLFRLEDEVDSTGKSSWALPRYRRCLAAERSSGREPSATEIFAKRPSQGSVPLCRAPVGCCRCQTGLQVVRMHDRKIVDIDAWIAMQGVEITRVVAIRRLVEIGLKAKK